MRFAKPLLLSTGIAGLLVSPAMAALSASATTELNLRAGPGPEYAIESVIPAAGDVEVVGCLDNGEWCEVSFDGQQGWAYAAYLTTPVEEEPVVLYNAPSSVSIDTVTYEDTSETATGAAAGGLWGAAAGALLIGGPAAAAAGLVAGAGLGGAAETDETTVTYIRENPVEPVYLTGEVVPGAGIPQEVELYTVPDSDYSYVNVNRLPVVVDTESRTIVQVVR